MPELVDAPRARRSGPAALVAAVRLRQWPKNLLVLAVPAAAGALGEPRVIRDPAIALAAFCLASAGTYMLNDVADREADRAHPTKRLRPVAAGELSVRRALAVGALLLVASCALAALAGPRL